MSAFSFGGFFDTVDVLQGGLFDVPRTLTLLRTTQNMTSFPHSNNAVNVNAKIGEKLNHRRKEDLIFVLSKLRSFQSAYRL